MNSLWMDKQNNRQHPRSHRTHQEIGKRQWDFGDKVIPRAETRTDQIFIFHSGHPDYHNTSCIWTLSTRAKIYYSTKEVRKREENCLFNIFQGRCISKRFPKKNRTGDKQGNGPKNKIRQRNHSMIHYECIRNNCEISPTTRNHIGQ